MVIIPAARLRTQVERIFFGHGASEHVAQRLADSLVESNLVGHDSHGVLRVPEYGERIRAGTLKLDGAIQVVRETAATALIDCGWNLGQVALPQGMQLAISKARNVGIGMVVLGHCDHTGRVGEYVVSAAEQGMIGQLTCNGSLPGGIVAPYGGIRRTLGANPICAIFARARPLSTGTSGRHTDSAVRVWNPTSGLQVEAMDGHAADVTSVALLQNQTKNERPDAGARFLFGWGTGI